MRRKTVKVSDAEHVLLTAAADEMLVEPDQTPYGVVVGRLAREYLEEEDALDGVDFAEGGRDD